MRYDFKETETKLQNILPAKRYRHTLGVSYTSACLSMKYGYDMEKAQMAGLLHDCAKYMSDEKLLKKCRDYSIQITKTEEKSAYLLHAKLGAYYAKRKYHIEEPEILNAITYHTTGRPDMKLLEKIVFTADYIEPSRKIIPGLNKIRNMAFENLDIAVFLILEHTLSYLSEIGQDIDETTIDAYEFYKKERGSGL